MCPLRVLLIFLSAALAGFFVLMNLKAQSELNEEEQGEEEEAQVPLSAKVMRSDKDKEVKSFPFFCLVLQDAICFFCFLCRADNCD